jgi:DNA-binding transcriptional MerR regulator
MLSMSEAARAAGVAPHRIKYGLKTGLLKEPARAGGRRCFTPEDVERIRRHFAAQVRAGGGPGDGRGKEAF